MLNTGENVVHKTFGKGVVIGIDDNCISVEFQNGIKKDFGSITFLNYFTLEDSSTDMTLRREIMADKQKEIDNEKIIKQEKERMTSKEYYGFIQKRHKFNRILYDTLIQQCINRSLEKRTTPIFNESLKYTQQYIEFSMLLRQIYKGVTSYISFNKFIENSCFDLYNKWLELIKLIESPCPFQKMTSSYDDIVFIAMLAYDDNGDTQKPISKFEHDFDCFLLQKAEEARYSFSQESRTKYYELVDFQCTRKMLLSLYRLKRNSRNFNNYYSSFFSKSISENEKQILDIYKWMKNHELLNLASSEILSVSVYKSKCGCEQKHFDQLTCVTCYIDAFINNRVAPINLLYCNKCDRYFIHINTLRGYQDHYGPLDMYLNDDMIESYINDGYSFENRREYSSIRLMGYSVDRNGLSDTERQFLLARFIDQGYFDKAMLISHINHLITERKGNYHMINAVHRWKMDLDFLNQYKINTQQKLYRPIIFQI